MKVRKRTPHKVQRSLEHKLITMMEILIENMTQYFDRTAEFPEELPRDWRPLALE